MNRCLTKYKNQARRHCAGSENNRCVRPKQDLLICLGWLRLFNAIASKNSRTRHPCLSGRRLRAHSTVSERDGSPIAGPRHHR